MANWVCQIDNLRDESLVDEIRSRKPAVDDRDLHRQIRKAVRGRYTRALDDRGTREPIEYAIRTNETSKALHGGAAKQMRMRRGLAAHERYGLAICQDG